MYSEFVATGRSEQTHSTSDLSLLLCGWVNPSRGSWMYVEDSQFILVQISLSGKLFLTICLGVRMWVQFSITRFCSFLEMCPTGHVPRETRLILCFCKTWRTNLLYFFLVFSFDYIDLPKMLILFKYWVDNLQREQNASEKFPYERMALLSIP